MPVEKDLLISIAKGDEHAFKTFFEYYIRKVFQFTLNYVRNKAEAEDLAQMVFVKIWEKRAAINPDKSIDGFVFTIAYRTVIDSFRQSATKFNEKDMQALTESMASTARTDDLLQEHQLESLYEKSLRELPPKRKEIFILSRHNGLSNREIGVRLGLSVKTVENQITAALATLKKFFYNSDLIPALIFCMIY